MTDSVSPATKLTNQSVFGSMTAPSINNAIRTARFDYDNGQNGNRHSLRKNKSKAK